MTNAAMAYHLVKRIFKEGDWDWRQRANCAKPWGRYKLFFVDRNPDNRNYDVIPVEESAKRLCVTCPVRRDCLKVGIGEEYGIWGGTLPKERRITVGPNRYKARIDVDVMLEEMAAQAIERGYVKEEEVA